VTHRDFTVLTAFFPEAQHAVIAQVAVVGHRSLATAPMRAPV